MLQKLTKALKISLFLLNSNYFNIYLQYLAKIWNSTLKVKPSLIMLIKLWKEDVRFI